MKTIHKYNLPNLPLIDEIVISMPEGAEILTTQMQRGNICLWALVETENNFVFRHFRIVGTEDYALDCNKKDYIGTLQSVQGFVWHIFEKKGE